MGSQRESRGELVQGTLDMLILKTLTRGPQHGYGIAQSSSRHRTKCCVAKKARCIRRCIAWSSTD